MELKPRRGRYFWMLTLTWGLFFAVVFARMVAVNGRGIQVGHENVWSDWALHIGLATVFAEKAPGDWFAYHPMYADGKMTYTFLTNLVSGLLMRAGLPLALAFILPSIAFAGALLAGMFRLLKLLTGSRRRAYLGVSVFFLSAGLGFVDFLRDFRAAPSLEKLLLPVKQFSRMDEHGWYGSNFVVAQLVPQRSCLLGMALAVWASALLLGWLRRAAGTNPRRRPLLVAALLAGLLPIAHMHSLIAMVFLMAPVFILHRRRWRELVAFFILPGGLLAGLLYFSFIHGGIQNPHFMSWRPFYTSDGFGAWLRFWAQAWGLLLPLAAWAAWSLRRGARPELRAYALGGAALFAVSNLVYFQPISWDNSKLMLWAYFALGALVATGLEVQWRRGGWRRPLAAVALCGLTATGAIELLLLLRIDHHTLEILTPAELRLADEVRGATGPRDRFLTSKDHNHWVMVRAARPMLLGYTGWVWNFGFDYGQTEKDVDAMYRGGAEALALLRAHRIHYVVIGPAERRNFNAARDFFVARFPVAFRSDDTEVFDVTRSSTP